jgi:acetyl-CoA carboxylase beta subunit
MLSNCVWKRLSEKAHAMTITLVVECNNCGGLLLAAINQKTRMCPYCGARVDLQRAKRLAKAQDAFEASEILRKIKSERQSNARKLNLK